MRPRRPRSYRVRRSTIEQLEKERQATLKEVVSGPDIEDEASVKRKNAVRDAVLQFRSTDAETLVARSVAEAEALLARHENDDLVSGLRLDLTCQRLSCVPAAVVGMAGITELSVVGNRICELPVALGKCWRLRVLNAGANELRGLPRLNKTPLLHVGMNGNLIKDDGCAPPPPRGGRRPRPCPCPPRPGGGGRERSPRVAERGPSSPGLSSRPRRAAPPLAAHRVAGIVANLPTSTASLDVANNELCNLTSALAALKTMPALRHLSLKGNPMCLRPAYASAVAAASVGRQLLLLDGRALPKATAADGAGGEEGGDSDEDDEDVGAEDGPIGVGAGVDAAGAGGAAAAEMARLRVTLVSLEGAAGGQAAPPADAPTEAPAEEGGEAVAVLSFTLLGQVRAPHRARGETGGPVFATPLRSRRLARTPPGLPAAASLPRTPPTPTPHPYPPRAQTHSTAPLPLADAIEVGQSFEVSAPRTTRLRTALSISGISVALALGKHRSEAEAEAQGAGGEEEGEAKPPALETSEVGLIVSRWPSLLDGEASCTQRVTLEVSPAAAKASSRRKKSKDSKAPYTVALTLTVDVLAD